MPFRRVKAGRMSEDPSSDEIESRRAEHQIEIQKGKLPWSPELRDFRRSRYPSREQDFTRRANLAMLPRPRQGLLNSVTMYILQGGAVYCDAGGFDSEGYSFRSAGCWLPDWDNNIEFLRIRPNSFTGTFQVQVNGGLNAKAVPGLDGMSNNQDLAVWVWNAY